MAIHDKPFKIGEKEGDEQIADVHAIDIGIGGQDHFVVAQIVNIIFNIKRTHQIVHLFIFIELIQLHAMDVEGFPRREKTAWVRGSRDATIEALAESPSVRKIIV